MIGIDPRTRASVQAANASMPLTSSAEVPTTRSEASSTRKTVSWPVRVASVSTCQRRPRRRFVRLRKRTKASPSQVTGFFLISRRAHEATRAARSPTRRASLAVLRPAAKPATTTTKIASPITAIVSSAA